LNLWNSIANYTGYKIDKNAFGSKTGDVSRKNPFFCINTLQKQQKIEKWK
jgi:hypothetical protein